MSQSIPSTQMMLAAAGLAAVFSMALHSSPEQDQTVASRFHQRQHSNSAFATASRPAFRSSGHGSSAIRNHTEPTAPAAPRSQQPKSMIARKPGQGVQS